MVQRYRLFVQAELSAGNTIRCEPSQAHYLLTVLRLKSGTVVGLFNGIDGEWDGELLLEGRKAASIRAIRKVRDQAHLTDLIYLFAPIKRARLDYMVQKATEMGVSELQPVITQHTNTYRLKIDRMRLNAIEAAEQCNQLAVPEVHEPVRLLEILKQWPQDRILIFCDEQSGLENPIERLGKVGRAPLAVLTGPEGGFSGDEISLLRSLPFVVPISLGPRIMRADTAAVAALALVQAVLGDWGG